jgi:DNA-binding response OmpR family regulator/EAL domain-containing protein (putative c-di-GMP-specific phosphodiesterase class I)
MSSGPQPIIDETVRPPAGSLIALWKELSEDWTLPAAQHLADRVDALFDAATGEQVTRLGDLAAYFATFIETNRAPNTAQRIRLEELVKQAALSRIDATHSRVAAPMRPEPTAMAPQALPSISPEPIPFLVSVRQKPQTARNSVCMIGVSDALAPGLAATLTERGYEVAEFASASAAYGYLRQTAPGAVVMLAPQLRALPSLQTLWSQANTPPALVVLSPNRDLTHRLLSLRANAAAFFAAPLDSYRIASRLDELLGHQALPPYRVLIVEDDRDLAIQCGNWVAGEGMTARIAAYGSAAIAAIGEFQPDLVLIDASLPDARGVDLVQVIRQQPEHAMLPIVLMSTAGDAGERFDAIAAGADEVLVKPLKSRHVIGIIRARVQRAQWLRAQAEAGAARDPKSGFYPRSVLADRIPARFGTVGSVLMALAIDDADLLRKQIGTSGLTALDVEVGQRLRELLAPHDMAGTLRDCVWMILITRERREVIMQLAERIRFAIVERPLSASGVQIPMSVSIGLVELEEGEWTVDSAIGSAETAIEIAQQRGGNTVAWFEGFAAASPDPALAVRAVLSRELDPRHVRVEYRPLVPLKGTLHGQFDLQFFLASAQDSGSRANYATCAQVANELGVRQAFERLRLTHALDVRSAARNERQALRLLMPMTADWLIVPGEVDWLLAELANRKLAGPGFTFELPSAELLDHRNELQEPLAKLRAAGLRVGLSDYGRDFAAVHILTQLPVDTLRLDAELVDASTLSSSANPTLLALVRKAHQLGAMVIGPSMDRPERAHVLLRLGIDYGVGDAFGPATTQPDFDFSRPLW